ncbi:MAG: prephenate dehydrogenase [Clostridia bacterium]|nr:prephenate dehydrogenase [Clostridia bacterium]
MKLDKTQKILIVGLGLIGGSYAAALRARGHRVSAITKEQSSLDYALSRGIIDEGSTEIDPAMIRQADVVIFALYPHVFLDWIRENQSLFSPGTILTDVTGVKGAIVCEIQQILRPDVEFIAAHPMAGREVCGVENSDPAIFRGANYIVVPTEKNTEGAKEFCRSLGEALGFRTIGELSPEKHDEMIAFLSQLTHCIAVSLMCASDDPDLREYTGDSFRDLTRIARINEEMWSELFLLNRDALLREIDRFLSRMGELRAALADGDAETMKTMMRLSTERRRHFDRK